MATTNGRPEHITFLVWMRGLACLLVIWDHLVGMWTDQYHVRFDLLTLIRHYLTTPLGIIQNFGYFGVVLFFFVSGFIITHVAQRENRFAFLVKRFFRIYPPFIVSIIVIMLFHTFYSYYLPSHPRFAAYLNHDGTIIKRTWSDILYAMTLVNYMRVQANAIQGVAWTLVIEVIFYLFCLCVLPLLQRYPIIGTMIVSVACLWILFVSHNYGAEFFLFAASVAYLPLLLIGQITYLFWSRRMSTLWFTVALIGNWMLFIYGITSIHTQFYPPDNSYAISTVYAYSIFVMLLLINDRLRVPKLIRFYSEISYSLYLYHGLIGYLFLAILYPITGYPFALFVALLAATSVSYLSWRYIEKPSQQLAHAILGKYNSMMVRHS